MSTYEFPSFLRGDVAEFLLVTTTPFPRDLRLAYMVAAVDLAGGFPLPGRERERPQTPTTPPRCRPPVVSTIGSEPGQPGEGVLTPSRPSLCRFLVDFLLTTA